MITSDFTLVLATGNQGKVSELQAMLASQQTTQSWQVRPQSEWNVPEAEETGTTFVENAIIKARNACLHTGLPAIADDSGLEIPALDGAPGVYSARYAGEHATDQDNNDRVLADMSSIKQRQARFHCVLVYMRHAADPTPLICHGQWHGELLTHPQGDHGFGYDPIFYIADQQCSAAQLDKAAKQQLSHRGKALSQLLQHIAEQA